MVGHVVATESQNGATVYVNRTTDITLKLKENPTTGYQWNLTVTPGEDRLKTKGRSTPAAQGNAGNNSTANECRENIIPR